MSVIYRDDYPVVRSLRDNQRHYGASRISLATIVIHFDILTNRCKERIINLFGHCDICGSTELLDVDHCHDDGKHKGCGQVRGILCFHCNILEGWDWHSVDARYELERITSLYPRTNYHGTPIRRITISDDYRPSISMFTDYSNSHACHNDEYSSADFAILETLSAKFRHVLNHFGFSGH